MNLWLSINIYIVSCPLRLVSRHRCAELRFVLLSRVFKGMNQVSRIVVLTRMIASGSSQLCAFNWKINVYSLFASIILQGLRGHSVGLVNWLARE